MQNVLSFKRVSQTINWRNTIMVVSFHIVALGVFFTFSWQNLAALVIGNWIVGSLGVGLGYARVASGGMCA